MQSIALYKNAKRVLFTEAELYRYRMNPTSITHSIDYNSFQVVSTVRQAVWAFLKQENVWSEKDYIDYIVYCKRCLKNDVRLISGFKTTKENKFKLFDEIIIDDYYKLILEHTKHKDHILNNLKRKKYNNVLFICWIYSVLSKVKRLLKKEKN